MNDENPPLLALPLELRELIYKEVLSDPLHGPQLLRVCRKIHSEAGKFLYQRPVVFQSQTALHEWLAQRPHHVLQDAHEIFLELQDVDLTPVLVSAASENPSERSRSLRTWELYEEELAALDQAFKMLPNVNVVTIRALDGRQTHLYDEFLAKTLQMIASHWPALCDLSLEGNIQNQSLEFLKHLDRLTTFSFDGFSATRAAETTVILSGLNLERISIVTQPALLTPTHGQHSKLTSKVQSSDDAVLRTVNQLAPFSITERVPTRTATSSALFFISEILGSLHSHKTLSTLSLQLSCTPDEDTLDALNEFLNKSGSVERLELDWPHLDPAILYILTNRLKSLWIRAAHMSVASDILGAILESKEDGDVQHLRTVVLIRSDWDQGHILEEVDSDDEGDTDGAEAVDFAAIKTSLNELGVEVAWHTEIR